MLLTSYIHKNITLKKEVCEILNCIEACNVQEQARIEKSWVHMMHKVSRGDKEEGLFQSSDQLAVWS